MSYKGTIQKSKGDHTKKMGKIQAPAPLQNLISISEMGPQIHEVEDQLTGPSDYSELITEYIPQKEKSVAGPSIPQQDTNYDIKEKALLTQLHEIWRTDIEPTSDEIITIIKALFEIPTFQAKAVIL